MARPGGCRRGCAAALILVGLISAPLAFVAWAWADQASTWAREQVAGSPLTGQLAGVVGLVALGLAAVAVICGGLAALLILSARERSQR